MDNYQIPLDLTASIEASASAATTLPLFVPKSMSQAIIAGRIIPVVANIAISLIRTGFAIKKATAYYLNDTSVQVTLYDRFGKELKNEIIEVIAPIKATMTGLNILRAANLDEDLLILGEDTLKKRLKSKLEKI